MLFRDTGERPNNGGAKCPCYGERPMTFEEILRAFTDAVEAGDGSRLARLFTEDGVYHDTFYGEFQGRAAIRDMLENRFWRDASAFRWDMRDPIASGDLGYAAWSFSYASKLPGVLGKRIVFEGMSRFRLKAGRIERYDEIFDMGIALSQTAFAPDRIARIVGKAGDAVRARHAATRHLEDQD